MDERGYVTKQELAAHFRKSTRTIERWETKGDIPLGVKLLGAEKRWKLDEVERYLDKRFKKLSRVAA